MPPKLGTVEFIKRANIVHNNFYDYSKVVYVGVRLKVIIICPLHGEFNQSYELHVRRKSGCRLCGNATQSIKKRTSIDSFIKMATLYHDLQYDYTLVEFNTLRDKIKIICKKHGIFKSRAYSHLYDKHGCQKCAIDNNKLTNKQFINKAINIYGSFYDYSSSKYTGNKIPVIIICPNHGKINITPAKHYEIGCYKCKKNRMEDNWLDFMNIPNDGKSRQVKLTLLSGKTVRVDGIDSDTNTIYLFHGDFWHGNPMLYKPNDVNPRSGIPFGILHQKTIDYERNLVDNGYKVISIWESSWKELKRKSKRSKH